MRPMVWFRSDLRTRDNPALFHAAKQAERGVLGVFIVCPRQWDEHDWGSMKVDFVMRNVAELSASLKDLNIPLLIETVDWFDDVPERLMSLAEEHQCTALYCNREYEVNELRRDEAVAKRFLDSGRQVHTFDAQLMLSPAAVRTNNGDFYSVYSPFRNKWYQMLEEAGDCEPLAAPSAQPALWTQPSEVPSSVDGFSGHTRPDLWKAGEEHAARRLGQFVGSRIDDYKTRRNFPAVNGTSTMSPYLTMGVVSPRQCFAAGVEANGGRIAGGKAAIKSWLDELVWREFYKHVLIGWPKVSMRRAYRAEYEQIHWNDDEQLFERWCEGMTGVPLVDAGMRQLNQTGWMHNRVRMVVAMYLTKDMFIDWRWGERYFMQKLVDGDLASNNGGWQWSASTGTDAAPYFRIFNPVSQSERFDADGKFIRQFVPELKDVPAKYIHDPYAARGKLEQLPDYPEPAVDHQQARQAALEAFKALKS